MHLRGLVITATQCKYTFFGFQLWFYRQPDYLLINVMIYIKLSIYVSDLLKGRCFHCSPPQFGNKSEDDAVYM